MVSQAAVQAHVSYGLGKAAAALGAPNPWYRPAGAGAVLVAGNLMGTLQVLLDTGANLGQNKPENFGKPEEWFGAFATAGVLAGDYIVGSPATDGVTTPFFVAALDWFRPARLIRCNTVVNVARPGSPTPGLPIGLTPQGFPITAAYGGDQTASETPLLTGWPIALIDKRGRQDGEVKLPGDMSLGYRQLYFPASVPLQLVEMDVVYDSQVSPARYIITAVENTPLGWRVDARVAVS